MVSGGAATLNNSKLVLPRHDDLVEWCGHKEMGIGIVDFSVFGKSRGLNSLNYHLFVK